MLDAGDAVLFKASRGDRPRPRASRRSTAGGGLTMLYWLLYPLADAVPGVQRLPLHHVPDGDGGGDGARSSRSLLGPGDDPVRCSGAQIGQSIREEGPKSHLAKAGTPTMGGLLILLAVVVGDAPLDGPVEPVRVDRARRRSLALGAVGFADDCVEGRPGGAASG